MTSRLFELHTMLCVLLHAAKGVLLLPVRRFKPWWLRLKSKVATTLSKAKTILLFCYNPACASEISNLSYMLPNSCRPFLNSILPREKEVVGGYAPADPFFNRYTFRVQQTISHERFDIHPTQSSRQDHAVMPEIYDHAQEPLRCAGKSQHQPSRTASRNKL